MGSSETVLEHLSSAGITDADEYPGQDENSNIVIGLLRSFFGPAIARTRETRHMQNALLRDLCPRFQTGKENSLCQTHTYHLLTSLILSYHRKIEFSRLELIQGRTATRI